MIILFKKWYNFMSHLLSRMEWTRSPNRIGDYTYYEFLINKRDSLKLNNLEDLEINDKKL